jgi:hypothetical protein
MAHWSEEAIAVEVRRQIVEKHSSASETWIDNTTQRVVAKVRESHASDIAQARAVEDEVEELFQTALALFNASEQYGGIASAKMRHHGQTLAYSPTWRTS